MGMNDTKAREVLENIQARAISTDTSNYIAVANKMVLGQAKLTLNEHKLLRLLVMQIKPDDEDFYTFRITNTELSQLFGIPQKNISRDLKKMVKHIRQQVIEIEENPDDWEVFNLLNISKYKHGVAVFSLHESLKPFLIGLRELYTQYRLEEICAFRSTYAIRIYELIMEGLKGTKPHAGIAGKVYADIDTIRQVTGTVGKYDRISQFSARVIDIAVRDINEHSPYHVEAEPYKESRKIVGYYFLMESHAGYSRRIGTEKKKTAPEQMTINFT